MESYTKTKPVSLSDSTITYGPHKNVAAFSSSELIVHSENNSPMLVVSSLSRLIEVMCFFPVHCPSYLILYSGVYVG